MFREQEQNFPETLEAIFLINCMSSCLIEVAFLFEHNFLLCYSKF